MDEGPCVCVTDALCSAAPNPGSADGWVPGSSGIQVAHLLRLVSHASRSTHRRCSRLGRGGGLPTLAAFEWVLARAKVPVPLARSFLSFLHSTKFTFAPFFGGMRHGAETLSSSTVLGWGRSARSPDVLRCESPQDPIFSFMARVCSGNYLWPSALGSCPLPALHLSPLISW